MLWKRYLGKAEVAVDLVPDSVWRGPSVPCELLLVLEQVDVVTALALI